MTQANPDRLDRIEATLETVVLAIRELSNKQDRTQSQLDQLQETVQENSRQIEANSHQIALNSEQISEMRAGIVELRNLVADVVRNQR